MLRDCSSLQKPRILQPHNCVNETLSNELTATSDKQDDGWRSTDPIHKKYFCQHSFKDYYESFDKHEPINLTKYATELENTMA